MKIKSLIVVDENGKEYAFTHRSVVENKEYNPVNDPEVQGVGLAELQAQTQPAVKVEPLKAKKKKSK